MSKETVTLTERGTTAVSRSLFIRLQSDPLFIRLIQDGAISLVQTKTTPHGLKAGALVGEAALKCGVAIKIVEKEPDSLRALIKFAQPSALKIVDVPATTSKDGELLNVLAARFLSTLGGYLQRGLLKEYQRIERISTFPRGRIHISNTIKQISLGRAPKISTIRQELSADRSENQILKLALLRAEAIFRIHKSGDELALCRQFLLLFAGVTTHQLGRLTYEELRRRCEAAGRTAGEGTELKAALAYARPLLFGPGMWGSTEDDLLPEAFFIDLEKLFEEAVFECGKRYAFESSVIWSKGGEEGRGVFKGVKRYLADPDGVLHLPGQRIVFDCKYKVYGGMPDHSDVYQILAHSMAFGSSTACLVYPASDYKLLEVGTTETGIILHSALLRPRYLQSDVDTLMKDLGATPYKLMAS